MAWKRGQVPICLLGTWAGTISSRHAAWQVKVNVIASLQCVCSKAPRIPEHSLILTSAHDEGGLFMIDRSMVLEGETNANLQHLSRFGSALLPRLRPDCPARPILVRSSTMRHN